MIRILLATITLVTSTLVASEPKRLDYNRDVRPILSDNCFYCHGPDANHREADLRLDDEQSAKELVIEAGAPDESEAYQRIISDDQDAIMPPLKSGKHLTEDQIEILRRWIVEGAEYQEYWAYVTPKAAQIPETPNPAWPAGPIDCFIADRLHQEKLTPSDDANRRVLARRLSLDLTGLPPTPTAVERFVNDQRPDSYSRYVDTLLASPAYGERMATYWLDLVRYADTVGYHGDQDHSISPYRDYVIQAFNENIPFDRFTREQLAGDMLPESGLRQRIASGYNRLLQTSHEGGVQPKEYLAIYAADRIRNLSSVWMGATVGCSQCHDHKFDPYTMKDFYSLAAFFADIDEMQHFKTGSNVLPTRRDPEIVVLDEQQQSEIDALNTELAAFEDNSANKEQIDAIRGRIESIQKSGRRTMITATVQPRITRVLPRGNWLDDSGEIVSPAIPEFLGEIYSDSDRLTRLDLADWLVTDNGVGKLTSRVMVNRLWYQLFGVGIVKTLDDFGGQGEPPEHPELLDHLALEFVESGWDIKHIIRRMVTSRTYRQSSVTSKELAERDPYNRLYARQSKHRLPAEAIRDSALSTSGLLVRAVGGDSVKPYQPAGYYRHLNFPTRKYVAHDDTRQWRRGVYVHWQRQFLHPMLKAFDAPSREECTANRPRSNTPLAALTLLNDPSFVEAARVFAQRIVTEGGNNDVQRMSFAYQWALSRDPDPVEQKVLLRLLNANRNALREDSEAVTALVNIGNSPKLRDVAPTEVAAWTMVARAIMNLDETITRN